MFRRTYLGLEIRADELRAIAVQRRRGGLALLGERTRRLNEGVLTLQAREPNILQPEPFMTAVREVLGPLTRRENRIAVALPDAVGHLFLLDLETPPGKQQEGEEMVRWRLKELLPAQFKRVALAYQVLEERDSGSKRVLVSTVAREILQQYEEELARAGFGAALIDFHSLNIYNAYRSRIDLGNDFVVVSVAGGQLSLLVFENRRLEFFRVKSMPSAIETIFHELDRSLLGYRQTHSGFGRYAVYLHSDWEQCEELRAAIQALFEKEVEVLPSPLHPLLNTEQLAIPSTTANGLAAALGVAERLIPRLG